MIEALELIIYFREDPLRIEEAVQGKLPPAGVIAKKIQGRLKRLREYLNEHASHFSLTLPSVVHLVSPKYWSLRGNFGEGYKRMEAPLAKSREAPAEVRPKLLDGAPAFTFGDSERAVALVGALPSDYEVDGVGAEIRRRYGRLWGEITREEVLSPQERYRIQERIRALNALGFSVEEVELTSAAAGDRLHLRVFVADRNFHRDLLLRLTGVEAEEAQARQMMGEIQELKATLSQQENRSMPLSLAAQRWLADTYLPITAQLRQLGSGETPLPELYCQLLEHKWYLSEAAGRDVGHLAALEDFGRRLTAT